MDITRRSAVMIGAVGLTVTTLGALSATSLSTGVAQGLSTPSATIEAAIDAFTGGAAVAGGAIGITAPQIAEDGNIVPLSVEAPGAKRLAIFGDNNPVPKMATFQFGRLSADRQVATRIRLARTQHVIVVAEMADGSFQRAEAKIDVVVGGCGA